VVAGYEALARFADGPPVSPDVWFAEAARQGRVCQLEAAMLSAALAERSSLPANTFLTINVEPESLLDDAVMGLLRSHSPLDGLVVEVTEHRELGDDPRVMASLEQLRALGALIAVDDAGAGYSGLQQILTMRPQILKLDRALITNIDTDETKAALVEMLGVFANRIDAWVLAEGIETESEARRCASLGVPLAQGWFFARDDAPWAGIVPGAVSVMSDVVGRRQGTDGLRLLMQRAPSTPDHAMGRAAVLFAETSASHVVVVRDQRPVGMLTPSAALSGEMLTPLVANADSTPSEVAHRLGTSVSSDPFLPVVVTDNAGRYLGVVHVNRLLIHLASR
jgi:EAL domain-containing protein (putative c-di-GMP-specific phosphodiesterase class I)